MSLPARVLHVFDTLDSGGVSNFVMNAYRNIDRSQIQFDFAITSGNASVYDSEAEQLGGRIFYFDQSKTLIANLRRVIREQGPFAAIHSHVFFYSGLVLQAAKIEGIPIRIAHAHNAFTGEKRSAARGIYENSMRLLIRRNATNMLGCSRKACDYVFGKGKTATQVVPNGIDCKRFAFDIGTREKVRAEYGLTGKTVIGHIGRFLPAKNHSFILDVFQEMKKELSDGALLLVGDGPDLDAVKAKAAGLGLGRDVIFAGARKDVEIMYQAMDLFFFPSVYEGFGTAMVEAQMNGLAAVASDEVPDETNITGRVTFLPLDAPLSTWASTLMHCASLGREFSMIERIEDAFSISTTSNILTQIYLQGRNTH